MEEDTSSWHLLQWPNHGVGGRRTTTEHSRTTALLLVLGVKSRTLHVLGKCSTTELNPYPHPQAQSLLLWL